jgi:hypothetical protein
MSTKSPTCITTVNASIDAYDLLETSLNNLETWKAILPFAEDDIVGFNDEQVNLFDFLDNRNPELLLNKFLIRFDATKWPPTNDGLKAFMGYLQAIAEHNGTILIREGRGRLICTCGQKPCETDGHKSMTFDSNGVAVGLRVKSFHHDRKNQCPKGRQKCRATNTNKDTTGHCQCKLRLTLNIHLEKQSGRLIFASVWKGPCISYVSSPTTLGIIDDVQTQCQARGHGSDSERTKRLHCKHKHA